MPRKTAAQKASTEPSRPVGRPSTYTEEIADTIFERMINGENLSQICADPAMPSRAAIYRWRAIRPDFDAKYARAREALAEFLLDRIDMMADETNEANVQSMKVKIATAQWRAEKMAPRIYGPRVQTEITGAGGGAVQISQTTIDVRLLSADAREAFKMALLSAKTIEHNPNEFDED